MSSSRSSWRVSVYAFFILTLASSFYVYEFMIRVMPSAMTESLMQHFHIGVATLGFVASLFYYGYAPMQLPAGMLLDRFGARRLLTVSTLLCAISGLMFCLAPNIYIAGLGRFLTGFTASFAFVGSLMIAARWFVPERFAMLTGFVQFLGCVGAIVGEAPIALMVEHIGWRQTTLWFSLAGFVLAVLIYLLVRDQPKSAVAAPVQASPDATSGIWQGLKQVCGERQTWWVALYAFCIWAPVVIFPVMWGPSFLARLYNCDMPTATAMTSIIWVAIAIASPLAGWWSNRLGSRRIPLAVLALMGLLSVCVVLYAGAIPYWAMMTALFFLGCSAAGQVITFGLVLDNHHDRVMGAAVGFNNMAVILGGILFQPLVGYIVQWRWDAHPVYHAGVPWYGLADFRASLLLIPLCFVVALIVNHWGIKETGCQRLNDR